MKKERDFVESIQAAIKAHPGLRGAVTFKHAETLTSGIPDISVSILNATSWIEVKYLRKGEQLKKIVKTLQVVTCNGLATVCGGRCWIVVYEQQPERLTIWTPKAIASVLWPKMTGGRPCTPTDFPPDDSGTLASPYQWVMMRGAICLPYHAHEVIAELVYDAARR